MKTRLLALVATPLLALAACSSSPVASSAGTTASSLSEGDALARAGEWVAAELHYCQAPNHVRDYDVSCASVCNRTDNAAWDPYRSDCSGLVSWAWGLPAPGRTTLGFAPYVTDITHVIPALDLRPGDAINNRDHIVLFKSWAGSGVANFIEEPGCRWAWA